MNDSSKKVESEVILMLREKEDLSRTLRMFENLNRDHRIAIAASIDAYRREEIMQESERVKELQEA